MKLTLFGFIKDEAFYKLNTIEQNSILEEKGVLEKYQISSNGIKVKTSTPGQILYKIGLNETNEAYKISNKLNFELYTFLLNRYHPYIGFEPELFKAEFKNLTFGLSEKKTYNHALKKFNEIYELVLDLEIDKYRNKFQVLFERREKLKQDINNEREIILRYLKGDINFFDKNLFHQSQFLNDFVQFEEKLSVLLFLNETFSFEEDLYFGKNRELIELYNTIENPSFNFNVFKFFNEYISNITKFKHAHLVSLFFFLKKASLIQETDETFRQILENLYEDQIGVLKLSDPDNHQHEKRIQELQNQWDEFPK